MPNSKSISFWIARIVSFLFHPIWLPLLYISLREYDEEGFAKLFLIATICLIAFPGLVALAWMYIRQEVDFFVMSRDNRIVPLVAMLIGLAFFAVANGGFLPDNLFQGELMAVSLILVFFGLLVTLFWKISLHMVGWGAVLGFGIAEIHFSGSVWLSLAAIAVSIIVAWARIKLGSHDWLQIFVGFAMGLLFAMLIAIAFP